MQGMSLLLIAAKIQIQKPHLRWLLQSPPRSHSQSSTRFPIFPFICMMLLGLWLVADKMKEKERKFRTFFFSRI
jgi:hypothetical protein